MMQSKLVKILTPVMVLVIIGFLIFLFRVEVFSIFGIRSASVTQMDFRGVNITFNAKGGSVTIPPVYSDKSLDYIKKKMTEPAGLPLKIERKGNPLPFGIP